MTQKTPEEEQQIREQVRDALEKLTQFRLELVEEIIHGSSCLALRPAEVNSRTPSFSIVLSKAPRWVEASFEPDSFAGQLIRAIGSQVTKDPNVWMGIIREARGKSLEVRIRVDELLLELPEAPPEGWHSLEIEVRKPLPRRTNDQEVIDAWTEAAGNMLCFILSAVGVSADYQEPLGIVEGFKRVSLQTEYERSPINRWRSIQHHGCRCWVCDVKFDELYGALGNDFIEVHHLFPLSSNSEGHVVDPVTEMVPLCSNCHSMVHKESPPVHPVRLRDILSLPSKESVLATYMP
ncbi:putative restriction endonuclease [Actinobacteria bacterium IMCC26256]|nr:putative restriction endonuclease [Actinobacteria bacterium IMCC26256]